VITFLLIWQLSDKFHRVYSLLLCIVFFPKFPTMGWNPIQACFSHCISRKCVLIWNHVLTVTGDCTMIKYINFYLLELYIEFDLLLRTWILFCRNLCNNNLLYNLISGEAKKWRLSVRLTFRIIMWIFNLLLNLFALLLKRFGITARHIP